MDRIVRAARYLHYSGSGGGGQKSGFRCGRRVAGVRLSVDPVFAGRRPARIVLILRIRRIE
jgi:hypothetical protein